MKSRLIFLLMLATILANAQQYVNVSFNHVDKTVYGTFSKPFGNGPFQTIILVPGSGPTDRDGTVQISGASANCMYPNLAGKTLKPYKQLGDALTQAGYAVLRYNKIEYNYSSNIGVITFPKLWLPVESALKYLKTRADVDTNNLILIGHSEGSMLIPYVAKNRNDIKALISLAGARTPFDSILAKQIVDFTQMCGGNMAQAQADAQAYLNYFDTVRNQLGSAGPMFGVPDTVWYDYFQANDPVANNYNQANLKTLFLGMGQDYNVPPSELQRFQNEVTITNDFWSIPDLNHYMTPFDDPNLSTLVPDTIIYWLRQNGFATGLNKYKDQAMDVKIYPNPVQSDLLISIEKDFQNARYELTTILGEKISCGTFHRADERIDISALPSGIYFVIVEVGDNRQMKKIQKF
jgi:hypothetical protein